jgi:hypothetical protein
VTLSDGLLPPELLYFGGINEPQCAAAVAYLRSKLPTKERKAIAEWIEGIGIKEWVTKHHFPYRMQVRNILRRGGFDEARLATTSTRPGATYYMPRSQMPASNRTAFDEAKR